MHAIKSQKNTMILIFHSTSLRNVLRTITVSNNYLLQINYVTVTYTNYVIDTAANWYDDDHIWMCVRNSSERLRWLSSVGFFLGGSLRRRLYNREFKIYDAAGSATRSEFQLKSER